MEPLYRVILKKAWEISKKYKLLWIFGFFAVWVANTGEMQIFFNSFSSIKETSLGPWNSALFLALFKGIPSFDAIISGLLLLLIFLIIFLLVAWLVVVSQTAIIYATHLISENKKISFKIIFLEAQKYFLKVLGLNILSRALVGLLLFTILIPVLTLIVASGSKLAALFSIIVWIIFLPAAVIISFIMKYAINFVIIKKENFRDSIAKAWDLFRTNWLISIEMTLALMIISFIVGFVLLIITIIIVGPFLRIDLLTLYSFKNFALGLILFKILPLVVIYTLIGSWISVFQISSWTLLFEKLTSGKRYSKLVRVISSLSNYTKASSQVTKVKDINITPKLKKILKVKRRKGRPKNKK